MLRTILSVTKGGERVIRLVRGVSSEGSGSSRTCGPLPRFTATLVGSDGRVPSPRVMSRPVTRVGSGRLRVSVGFGPPGSVVLCGADHVVRASPSVAAKADRVCRRCRSNRSRDSAGDGKQIFEGIALTRPDGQCRCNDCVFGHRERALETARLFGYRHECIAAPHAVGRVRARVATGGTPGSDSRRSRMRPSAYSAGPCRNGSVRSSVRCDRRSLRRRVR